PPLTVSKKSWCLRSCEHRHQESIRCEQKSAPRRFDYVSTRFHISFFFNDLRGRRKMTWLIVGQIAGRGNEGVRVRGSAPTVKKMNFRDGLKIGTQLSSNGF